WNKKRKKWTPSISVNGKEKYLGRYDSIWEAICARKSAENRYSFHENHGKL
ncbi:HNH endonuclease, partial [Pectobacterium polonicum]